MSRQPDYDTWATWKTLMNMSANEVMQAVAHKGIDLNEAKLVSSMINNSSTWRESLNNWSGDMWEKMHSQALANKQKHPIVGNNPEKKLSEKPDRTQLMYGDVIKSYDGLMGFELSQVVDGSSGVKSNDELIAEEIFGVSGDGIFE